MIRVLILAALALVAGPVAAQTVVAQSATVQPLVEPDHAQLPTKLVWSDDFNGIALDAAKWPRNGVIRFPGQPADETLAAQTAETERYDPAEILFDAPKGYGYVHIRCEPDIGAGHIAWGQAVLPHVGSGAYSGQGLPRLFGVTDKCGSIHTYPNYVSPPGSLLELRVSIPSNCTGRWPAAWMFAYPFPGTPNPNAGIPFAGQENDVFEGNGLGQIKITLHNDVSPTPTVTVNLTPGWHVIRQWRDQKDAIVYEWIDGVLVAKLPAGNLNNLTLPVQLNMAGGTPNWSWVGLPDATTPRICDMLVDYARIYR